MFKCNFLNAIILAILFQVSLNPVRVLKGDTEEEKREDARLSCIFGAIAIGDLLKSTLGPKGMVSVYYINNVISFM